MLGKTGGCEVPAAGAERRDPSLSEHHRDIPWATTNPPVT